jgi:hypothetical protein
MRARASPVSRHLHAIGGCRRAPAQWLNGPDGEGYGNHKEAIMKTLNQEELEMAAGGISIFSPVNLFMTEQWGPVGLAFGVGYGIGTFLYNNRDQVAIAFQRAGVSTVVY